jgi:sugar phosphate isomerase/epimerase
MRNLADHLHMCAINTATLGFQAPLSTTIDVIARAGFGGIAPWRRELEGQDVATIARQIKQAGLKVTGLCRSTYMPAADRETFLKGVADNRDAITLASKLGADSFVLVVGSLPQGSKDIHGARQMVAESIALLTDHAIVEGVKLALEPLHPVYAADRSCITTLAEALDICEQLEHSGMKQAGVLIDVYHVWWDPQLAASITRAGNRIIGFHVCDWLVPTTDVLNDRGMMGDGVVDIRGIRSLVENTGYTGFVECEIFSANNWWKRPITETLEAVKQRMITVV